MNLFPNSKKLVRLRLTRVIENSLKKVAILGLLTKDGGWLTCSYRRSLRIHQTIGINNCEGERFDVFAC